MPNPLPLLVGAVAAAILLSKKTSAKTSEPGGDSVDLEYDESPAESDGSPGPPLLGASDCFGTMYGGRGRLNEGTLSLMSKSARSTVTPPKGRYSWVDKKGNVHVFTPGITYLSPLGQKSAYKLALSEIDGPSRSTLSIMTRNILKKLMPKCNWDVDLWKSGLHEHMSKEQYNLWTSVWYLVKAAAKQQKYRVGGKTPAKSLLGPAGGGPGLIVGRGFLDMPEVAQIGKVGLDPGRRIEIIVGDYTRSELPIPPLFHAESLIAYVVDSEGGAPLVEIVDRFQGEDVSPNFAHRHDFYTGRRIRLYASGTTGIRRIFPSGID